MTIDEVTRPAEQLARRAYAPLLEEFDYRIDEIEGELPKDLTGTLHRIGPGKHQVGRTLLHNVFDGDGMVSQFTLDGSSVRFRNRYVRTKHFNHGLRSNRIKYRGVGTQIPGGPLANFLRLPGNVANTNVVHHDGELLALWELGKPHRLHADTLDTLGEYDFGGRLGYLGAFSAHPKWDPDSGEMYNFGLICCRRHASAPTRSIRAGSCTPWPACRCSTWCGPTTLLSPSATWCSCSIR
jgi:all-trans-8'-apo-beta-carotenal 15,15'-oxygenase